MTIWFTKDIVQIANITMIDGRVLSLNVKSSEEEDGRNLEIMKWNVTKATNREVKIQL